ncbi:MAG: hypothetical protein MUC98_06050 [Desulfobacterota bacterium]|jgi:hypothetical protein|nr:hypothetical protein [Thermodesulfobacteriota bacterium]
MLKRIMLTLILFGLFLMSSCANGSYTSSSSDSHPNFPYTYKEMCGYGAVYCGPGP